MCAWQLPFHAVNQHLVVGKLKALGMGVDIIIQGESFSHDHRH